MIFEEYVSELKQREIVGFITNILKLFLLNDYHALYSKRAVQYAHVT